MKKVLWGVAIVLVASAGWRYRTVFIGSPEPVPVAKPIVFDNGTVRQYQAVPQSPEQAALRPLPSGVMRKCRRGNETNFTNTACPPGYSEEAVNASRAPLVSEEESTEPAPAQPKASK